MLLGNLQSIEAVAFRGKRCMLTVAECTQYDKICDTAVFAPCTPPECSAQAGISCADSCSLNRRMHLAFVRSTAASCVSTGYITAGQHFPRKWFTTTISAIRWEKTRCVHTVKPSRAVWRTKCARTAALGARLSADHPGADLSELSTRWLASTESPTPASAEISNPPTDP